MIPDWKSKKITFVMIPEANQQVQRIRISLLWLYVIPSLILTMAATVVVYASMQGSALKSADDLNSALESERALQAQTVAKKDEQIAKLQAEVLRLSQETEAFAAKLADLQVLEQELLNLTGGDEAVERPSAEALSHSTQVTLLSTAVGGEYVPLEDPSDSVSLSEETLGALQELTAEADRLDDVLHDALAEAEKIAHLRSITPSIFPTVSTQITSFFGYRRDPFTKKSAYHKGIDFGGNVGDPIFATAAGSVTRTGYDRAMGNYVFLSHGNGLETVYMHLKKSLVTKGQNVKKGEKIGLLGSTGRSTGPHLHYEVHKNGKPINPKPYVKGQKG